MQNTSSSLLSLSMLSNTAAALLRDAVCDDCSSCVSEISDLNRQMLSELTDLEQSLLGAPNANSAALFAAHAIGSCIGTAFSASLLLSAQSGMPRLSPLCEIVCANAQLAECLTQLASKDTVFKLYERHLYANKSLGAQALLLSHFCNTERGSLLLPLSLALEQHRRALGEACNALIRLG